VTRRTFSGIGGAMTADALRVKGFESHLARQCKFCHQLCTQRWPVKTSFQSALCVTSSVLRLPDPTVTRFVANKVNGPTYPDQNRPDARPGLP